MRNSKGQFVKGEKHPMFGKHHSVTHKEQVSKKLKGRVRSITHRQNLSKSLSGKTLPIEVRDKIRKKLTGRKLPLEHRLNMSLSQRGDKSHLYRDGLSYLRKTERQRIMQTMEYKVWRESVFKRDKYMCVVGGKSHGDNLEADHIKEFADYPKLRFVVRNGRTLCKDCHKKRHAKSPRVIL